MKTKTKLSQREVWLVVLLPAALVAIISYAIPGPADKVAELEKALERAGGNEADAHSQMRDLSQQLKQGREALAALEAKEAELSVQIQSLNKPPQQREVFNLAGALDELTRRLSLHGAQVLAMEACAKQTAAGRPVQGGRGQSGVHTSPQEWAVSVAATWPVLRAALADADAFPPGLALSAMKMEQAQPNRTLRRWELVVTAAEQSP